MNKRAVALFIVMLFVIPIPLSVMKLQTVTNPGGSNFQNETKPVLSYEEKETKHTACGGDIDSDPFITGDYWDTWADDASYLVADSSFYVGIILVFNITETRPVNEISFFLRWQVVLEGGGENPVMYWTIYNFNTSTYDTVYAIALTSTLNFEDREESITFDEKYVNATNHVRLYVYASTNYADSITVDYAYLTFTKGYDGEYRATLPDDVLYYPDPLRHTACDGDIDSDPFITGDYWDTWIDDASYLVADSSFGVPISLVFNTTEYANFVVDNATLSIFLRWQVVLAGGGDNPLLSWKLYNFEASTFDTIYSIALTSTLNFEDREESITFDEKYVNATNHVRFFVTSNSTYADDITVDYAYLTATNDYTESFADVSDWAEFSCEIAATLSTNGDVFSWEDSSGTDGNYNGHYTDISDADFSGMYIEIRGKTNDTTNYEWSVFRLVNSNDGTGVDYVYCVPDFTTSWTTQRFYTGDMTVEGAGNISNVQSINFLHRLNSASGVKIDIDYIRIGRSDEMGWQHDGSTTAGLSGDASWNSDGDVLNISTIGNYEYLDFFVDSTNTKACIDKDYYSFLEMKIDSLNDADLDGEVWKMLIYDGSVLTNLHSYTDETGVIRFNLMAAVGDDIQYFRLQMRDNAEWVILDYIKAYSIANFSITQSASCATSDVLYVEAGILYSEMDNGSFVLDYDPTFLLNGSTTWAKSTTLGESYLSFLHGGWTDYSNETTGKLYAGTTTDLRIKFNETANIQMIEYSVLIPQWFLVGTAIIYFDMPNWWTIAIADAVFYIPLGTYTLEFLLMIMGLVMIPFSTLFLVKGGREEMSRDKIFFFLLLFLMGWALVLGGLM